MASTSLQGPANSAENLQTANTSTLTNNSTNSINLVNSESNSNSTSISTRPRPIQIHVSTNIESSVSGPVSMSNKDNKEKDNSLFSSPSSATSTLNSKRRSLTHTSNIDRRPSFTFPLQLQENDPFSQNPNYNQNHNSSNNIPHSPSNVLSPTSENGQSINIIHPYSPSANNQTYRRHSMSMSEHVDSERRYVYERSLYDARKRVGSLTLRNGNTTMLPRGGCIVTSSFGSIQFGLPPESLKDALHLGIPAPNYYVLPKNRFNLELGINVAEFEFPAYFSFFIKRSKVKLVVEPAVEKIVRTVFRETLLGPEHIDLPHEYSDYVTKEQYPDLQREMDHFRVNPFDKTPLTVDTLIDFTHFNEGQAKLFDGQVTILEQGHHWIVFEGPKQIAKVNTTILVTPPLIQQPQSLSQNVSNKLVTPSSGTLTVTVTAPTPNPSNSSSSPLPLPSSSDPPSSSTVNSVPLSSSVPSPNVDSSNSPSPSPSPPPPSAAPSNSEVASSTANPSLTTSRASSLSSSSIPNPPVYFRPPMFGVTMLGNSDGFDVDGTTTGFVLWMNRRGIMVDPPPYSGLLLRKHGISPRLIRGIILSHCHADHDAGTFQKIIEDSRVVLMTTEVIMSSFLRKYSAISGLEIDFIRKLFVFRPVVIGEEITTYGGILQFFYSLHSIPCVGFSAFCNGKSMVYSADSFNDPTGLKNLREAGVLSEGRYQKLLNFPWHHDLILHEAGVPPIHTPMSTLSNLSDDIKSRLYVVHKRTSDVVKSNLKSALVGPENTIIVSDESAPSFAALEIMDLVGNVEILSSLTVSRGAEIIESAKSSYFEPGDVLIEEGSHGHTLYIIAMETVVITQKGTIVKYLTVGDDFGAISIATGAVRTATITAVTPLEVISFSKNSFLHLVRDTGILERIRQLGAMQASKSWQVMMQNSMLRAASSAQKTQLQSLLQKRDVNAGDLVWEEGQEAKEAILVAEGEYVFQTARDKQPFTRGAFLCDMRALLSGGVSNSTVECIKSGFVFCIDKEDLAKFCADNPGFVLSFLERTFVE